MKRIQIGHYTKEFREEIVVLPNSLLKREDTIKKKIK